MPKLFISFFYTLLLVFLKLAGASQYVCEESKCAEDQGPAIHFPLRRSRKHHCGNSGLKCNQTYEQPIVVKFFVKHINYKRQEILVDPSTLCLLLKPVEIPNMPPSPFSVDYIQNVTLFSCTAPVTLESTFQYQVPCLSDPGSRIYAVDSDTSLKSLIPDLRSCSKMYDVLSVPYGSWYDYGGYLQFKWSKPNCRECEAEGKRCRWKNNGTDSGIECQHLRKPSNTWKLVVTSGILGSSVLVLLTIAAYRVYSADRKEKESRLRIERFLEDYKALKPSRYSYADIRRITNQFKDKLGLGAYGTVFKGKLSSEFFIAVKVLNNSSKGDGEEFINEVQTMGQIHHVNVARLVGFCADGFVRALVYEFFPNGSLQDFISSADSKNSFLGWDKLQDIALGIAKGIEYLHQGCDQRILHFDIKPHNILLDQNFTPKISDFGLAKLCSKDQSMVSMTTARGTMGYIAPEVFSRNFGNVSYKADVYSFGMLLIEMVGGRKNIGSTIDNTTSEIYYPQWIYNLLEEGDDLRIHIGEEGDGKIPKKLAIVGLWCIQWHPVDRPAMKTAVQMLEGEGESLTMPPNPFVPTGPTTRNGSIPARRLELEAIAELE